jgi:hypothetical protein
MYGLLMVLVLLLLPGEACLIRISHFAASAPVVQRWARSWGVSPLARPGAEQKPMQNRLGFIVPSRAAHSIQMRISAHTNHKEYRFKQSSA